MKQTNNRLMNLKKYAIHRFREPLFIYLLFLFSHFLHYFTPSPVRKWGFATD